MLRQLSIASGAALLTLGLGAVNPTQAATLSKVEYDGSVSVTLTSPLFLPLGDATIDDEFIVDDLEQRLDGEFTIDDPLGFLGITNLLSQLSPFVTVDSIDFFAGAGAVFSNSALISPFVFALNSATNVLTINGFDSDSLKVCLVNICNLKGQGGIGLTATALGQTVPIAAVLEFDLDQTVTPLPVTDPQPVPEPATILGLLGVGALLTTRRRQKQTA